MESAYIDREKRKIQGQCTQSSFQRLPTEIRIEIYKHLFPNNLVSGLFENNFQRYFRHDEKPCYPAILCTNRQIYNEAIQIFYGIAKFCIYMRGYTAFLGHEFDIRDPKTTLPLCLQFIRKLNINIVLYTPQYTGKYLTGILIDSLSSGLYNLRHLRLSGIKFYRTRISDIINACLQDPEHEFKKMLEYNFGPLRALRGVTLDFAGLDVPWKHVQWLELRMYDSVYSRHTMIRLFKRMHQELYTTLRMLATDILQDTNISHREEPLNPPRY